MSWCTGTEGPFGAVVLVAVVGSGGTAEVGMGGSWGCDVRHGDGVVESVLME